MAGHLYEPYERLYLQQAELCEEAVVAGVRTAFAGFSRRYLQTLRSVAIRNQPVLQVNQSTSGKASSSNQQRLIDAQKEIDAARDSATRQLTTTIANAFGAISNFSLPALVSLVNQLAVSGTSNHAKVDQEAYDKDHTSMSIKSEDTSQGESNFKRLHSLKIEIKKEEDQTEVAITAANFNVDPNIDNVSIKKESESECESSDSESSSDEEEEFVGQPNTTKRKDSSSVAATKKAKQSHPVQSSAVAASSGTSQPEEPLKVIVKSLNCPEDGCTTVCKDKTSLDDHLAKKHAIEKYRCIVVDCTASFKNHFQLIDHRRSHGNPSNWSCSKCSSSFTDYGELLKHHNSLHEEGLFECSVDDCDHKESNRSRLQNHLNCHRTPKHLCSVDNCGRSFVKKCEFDRHLRAHTQERPYACELCDRAFAHKDNLKCHLRSHSGTMKARCTWPGCTFQAVTSSNVVRHIRGVHFKLPSSQAKQRQRGIVDDRDPRQYLEKM